MVENVTRDVLLGHMMIVTSALAAALAPMPRSLDLIRVGGCDD